MAKKTRAWFVDKLIKIGIVEKGTNTVTKDGYTTDWSSISEAKTKLKSLMAVEVLHKYRAICKSKRPCGGAVGPALVRFRSLSTLPTHVCGRLLAPTISSVPAIILTIL